MNTRFSPSLNGSLHLGHLWMAWVNRTWAKRHGGKFILRFDDLAPKFAGEDVSRMGGYAREAEDLLWAAGLVPDEVSFLSAYEDGLERYPIRVESRNRWLRGPHLEGHIDVPCLPYLVAARVQADIREEIGVVIRGEELLQELQLYECLNVELGGQSRELVYLPRLRVRSGGVVTTISKTYGNLQLRDLFEREAPEVWMERARKAGLLNPEEELTWENVNPEPIVEVEI